MGEFSASFQSFKGHWKAVFEYWNAAIALNSPYANLKLLKGNNLPQRGLPLLLTTEPCTGTILQVPLIFWSFLVLPEGIQVCFPTCHLCYRLLVGLIFPDHDGLHTPLIFPPAGHFYWGKNVAASRRVGHLRPTLEVLAFITAGMGEWVGELMVGGRMLGGIWRANNHGVTKTGSWVLGGGGFK